MFAKTSTFALQNLPLIYQLTFQHCQTTVQNSNSKRWESITLEPGKIQNKACYSELVLVTFYTGRNLVITHLCALFDGTRPPNDMGVSLSTVQVVLPHGPLVLHTWLNSGHDILFTLVKGGKISESYQFQFFPIFKKKKINK